MVVVMTAVRKFKFQIFQMGMMYHIGRGFTNSMSMRHTKATEAREEGKIRGKRMKRKNFPREFLPTERGTVPQ